LQKEILAWEEPWRLKLGNKVRWLDGKNLHITLVPPWYEEDLEKAKEQLKKTVVSFHPCTLLFHHVTFGPDHRRPRLVWAVGKPVSGMKLPHLTLARFREKDFASFPFKTLDEKISWRENVDSIMLMESRLFSSGADYTIIARMNL
jgi:2'-5' RNA ligase